MFYIPKRYGHFVFGVIQSGLTSAVASAIASIPFWAEGTFLPHAVRAWITAWIVMLPIVLLAAPAIRRMTDRLTR